MFPESFLTIAKDFHKQLSFFGVIVVVKVDEIQH
jgi:hypothetical protein